MNLVRQIVGYSTLLLAVDNNRTLGNLNNQAKHIDLISCHRRNSANTYWVILKKKKEDEEDYPGPESGEINYLNFLLKIGLNFKNLIL